MDDLLGFDRYEQHLDWRCSGRLEGDFDEIEPATYVVERRGDRWLLTTGAGDLVVVGDGSRDLVATNGGLERKPVTRGFATYLAANLARQIGTFTREWIRSCEVIGSKEAEHAGRPAVDVELSQADGTLTLGIDAETGIWTYMRVGDDLTISVEELTLDPPVDPAFAPLDAVPEVDLSHREPVSEALAPLLDAIKDASGLKVEVLYQDDMTFRFVLLDGEPVALVSRQPPDSPQAPAFFAGRQHWWSTEDWSYHIDTSSSDPMWSKPIVMVLTNL